MRMKVNKRPFWLKNATYFDVETGTMASGAMIEVKDGLIAAVSAKLPQDAADEPASVLLEQIGVEKERLIAAKTLKRLALGSNQHTPSSAMPHLALIINALTIGSSRAHSIARTILQAKSCLPPPRAGHRQELGVSEP